MSERLIIKNTNEELTNIMEKKFVQAFNILGNISTTESMYVAKNVQSLKEVHKAYDLLFDTMKIYKKMKEREDLKMDFGKAIQLLKEGKKLQRSGWNGKNQYIELARHTSYTTINNERIVGGIHHEIENLVIIFVGTSGIQVGWLASQADILAEDWRVVEDE